MAEKFRRNVEGWESDSQLMSFYDYVKTEKARKYFIGSIKSCIKKRMKKIDWPRQAARH